MSLIVVFFLNMEINFATFAEAHSSTMMNSENVNIISFNPTFRLKQEKMSRIYDITMMCSASFDNGLVRKLLSILAKQTSNALVQ